MQRRSEDDAGRGDLWFLSRVAALLLAIPVIILLLIVGFPACTDCENSIDNDNNGELDKDKMTPGAMAEMMDEALKAIEGLDVRGVKVPPTDSRSWEN